MGGVLIRRALGGAAIVLAAMLHSACALAQAAAKPAVYAEEDRDYGVASTAQFRTTGYHSPTPLRIPGGRVVTTLELKAMLERDPRPYVIDVLGGRPHRTVAGAFWMPGAGAGDMTPDEENRFGRAMANFAGGDKGRPLVFLCVDTECWLSYNAALRAIALGYTGVMWYRGGIAAWRHADLPTMQSDPFAW
jgi:PQQ-dependent catabolism-associated CXXCW motif protein